MLDKEFIRRKIKLMHENLADLEEIGELTFEDLTKDNVRWNAAEHYLQKIITRAIDINQHILAELGTGKEKVRDYHDTFLGLSTLSNQIYSPLTKFFFYI